MVDRIQPFTAAPDAYKALMALDGYLQGIGLSPALVEMVQTRSSQINGCEFCVQIHWARALQAGEDQQRLRMLSMWRDSPLFTGPERAALAWGEATTVIASGRIPDDVYSACLEHFTAKELVQLTMAVAVINVWNRFGVAFELKHPAKADALT